jgi:uncharacterized lipoprotein
MPRAQWDKLRLRAPEETPIVRATTLALPGVLIIGLLSGGCDFMHRHFGRDDTVYQRSVQERPLEVPPGLDHPDTSGALSIPEPVQAPAPGTATGSSEPVTGIAGTPDATPGAVPPQVSTSPGVVVSGEGLLVNDNPDSTYRRVGLALQRGGEATIAGRDDAAHSYTVRTTGAAAQNPGWFKRMITFGHAGSAAPAGIDLTVRVSAEGAKSRVTIEGNGSDDSRDAARALLGMLQQRLG